MQEAYLAGHLGKDIHGSGYDLDLVVHAGAGAYICGEETALLDSLEGRRGQPRLRPPFPAVAGLYASPTVINNVESIASVPSIIDRGAEWFASMGTEKSKGYGIFSLSGHVTNPGQFEAPLGITLRELIDLAGGMREGHELKFWTPGGSSTPLLTGRAPRRPARLRGASARPARCSAPARCRSSTRPPAWSGPCCAGRSSTSTSPAASAPRAVRAPGGWRRRWPTWSRAEGSEADLEILLDACDNILGRSFCALGDGATSPISSSIQYFRDEYLAHLEHGGCPFDREASTIFARVEAHGMTDHSREAERRRPTPVEKSDEVTLTIDGIEVSVPKNTLVIRAAEQIGVQIPRFCDHPLLAPVGACRQCLVEVPDARQRPRRCPSRRRRARSPSPRAWWSTPRPPPRSPTRRSRA